MSEIGLFAFQIQGESIMSKSWLSVKQEMAIRQTKQLVLLAVCVSTLLYCLLQKSYSLKWNTTPELELCITFASFSGQRPTSSNPSTSRSRDCLGHQFICSVPALEPSCLHLWEDCQLYCPLYTCGHTQCLYYTLPTNVSWNSRVFSILATGKRSFWFSYLGFSIIMLQYMFDNHVNMLWIIVCQLPVLL